MSPRRSAATVADSADPADPFDADTAASPGPGGQPEGAPARRASPRLSLIHI
ncbi:hypothetical protein KDW98_32290 [Burkholderia vietnamiensis]|uniref:hypothetical protein n=1 Tax=Burkholderia vietnamiensis TaxID=60552 RepID=UPI001B99E748|nr:hypothetical protein [Burkholderia vietnamiensis]MBR8165815.1 hypothetical protein [Burkholderia vietnamiensis]